MIWWVIIAIVAVALLAGGSKGKKKSAQRRSVSRDGWETYWAMRKRADQIKSDLEQMIWKHEDDESYWDRILQKYEAWLRQEEEAVKIPCIENDGTASYTPSETLFYILGRKGRHEDAERYVQRLSRLKHHDPKGKWQAALDQIQQEDQAALEHQEWLSTVPEQVKTLLADGRSAQLHKLATLCLSRDEADAAQCVVDAIEAEGSSHQDAVLVHRAGISRLRGHYSDAIRQLQSAYTMALSSQGKSRINRVEVEMRKVVKCRGAHDPAAEANRLLAETRRTEPSPPPYSSPAAGSESGEA